MDAAVRALLEAQLGSDGLQGDTIAPSDAAGVAEVLRILSDSSTPFRISSAAAAGVLTLSVGRLAAVSISPAALTLRAEAGATVESVTAAAHGAGLRVTALPDRTSAAHVGSLIARGEVPRRSLCGVEALLPSGAALRFGGGVLKDVVGYDVPALLLGSMGRLAVLVAVTFRLEPLAAHTPAPSPPGPSPAVSLLAAAFDPQGLLQAI